MHLLDLHLLRKEFQGDESTVVQVSDLDHEPDEQNSVVIRQVYRLRQEGPETVKAIREARAITGVAASGE